MSEKIDLRSVINAAKQEEQEQPSEALNVNVESTKGIIIDTKEETPQEKQGVKVTGLDKDTMASINAYLDDMDAQIELAKEEAEKIMEEEKKEKEDDGEIELDEEEDRNLFEDKYREAVVVIDKSGIGAVVNFTDEERKKLEKVKKIKLEEVETVELKTLKTKKVKKGNIHKILKKNNTIRTTQIVLPLSAITVTLRGCSTYELMALLSNEENTADSFTAKWGLIHSKIEDTSIGNMDFNTFLNTVSQMEYEVFVYGLLCATYPEEDIFPLTCPKCGKPFEHKYTVRQLLRAEAMSDKLKEEVVKIVDASFTEETAQEAHRNSLLNQSEAIVLPVSEYVFELTVQTAHRFITDSISKIEHLDKKYSQAVVLSSAVNRVLIPDLEDGGYFEITDTEDIVEVIFGLGSKDINILGSKIGKSVEDMLFEFGLMDVTCPNIKCGFHKNTVPVDIDSILFQKYQQAINTRID